METAAEPPASLGKALVACLVCKLVKTLDQVHYPAPCCHSLLCF